MKKQVDLQDFKNDLEQARDYSYEKQSEALMEGIYVTLSDHGLTDEDLDVYELFEVVLNEEFHYIDEMIAEALKNKK